MNAAQGQQVVAHSGALRVQASKDAGRPTLAESTACDVAAVLECERCQLRRSTQHLRAWRHAKRVWLAGVGVPLRILVFFFPAQAGSQPRKHLCEGCVANFPAA